MRARSIDLNEHYHCPDCDDQDFGHARPIDCPQDNNKLHSRTIDPKAPVWLPNNDEND
jgi:hypothetical protein